jgi:hypothetical protein
MKGDLKTVYQRYQEAFPDDEPIAVLFVDERFALDQMLELALQRESKLTTDERKALGIDETYPVPGVFY